LTMSASSRNTKGAVRRMAVARRLRQATRAATEGRVGGWVGVEGGGAWGWGCSLCF
jgi:hypothetical protein